LSFCEAAGDEESRIFMNMRRARFFAEFILSGQGGILRFAQSDSGELIMTAEKRFSAACLTPPFPSRASKQQSVVRRPD
jgi:hypothetical protein